MDMESERWTLIRSCSIVFVVNERRFDVIDAINHVDTPREVDKDPVMQDDLLKDNLNTLQPMNGQ